MQLWPEYVRGTSEKARFLWPYSFLFLAVLVFFSYNPATIWTSAGVLGEVAIFALSKLAVRWELLKKREHEEMQEGVRGQFWEVDGSMQMGPSPTYSVNAFGEVRHLGD